MKMHSTGLITLLVVFMTAGLLTQAHATINPDPQGETLTFGIAPTTKPEQVIQQWGPLVKYLSRVSGIKIQLKTAATEDDFKKQLSLGKYDIAYMNPNEYTIHNKTQGYMAFARESKKKVTGIIVVHKDSPYKTLADLKDQTLVFPKQNEFAASVLPQAKLKHDDIPIKASYVETGNSVYRSVVKGESPAGGGVMDSYEHLNPGVNSKLRVIWRTKQYTSHAFATHPGVSNFQRRKVQEALVSMHDDPTGASLLQSINFNNIEVAQDKDWDDVRALHIKFSE